MNVGNNAKVCIEGEENLSGRCEKLFTIEQEDIARTSVAPIQEQVYTGSEIRPVPEERLNGNVLSSDGNYTLYKAFYTSRFAAPKPRGKSSASV